MIYQAYQMCHDLLQPSRFFARSTLAALNHVGSRAWPGLGTNDLRSAVGSNGHGPDQNSDLRHPESMGAQRKIAAACEVFLHSAITHVRPAFGIASVHINGSDVAVHEDIVQTTAFARLIRFRKSSEVLQPRVLLVAPMSGHFATLLRETVRTLLVDHDVYITDWANARDVPLIHGRFGFDEYVSHLIAFLMDIGPGAHVMAVCQPCVAALAAVAVMAEDEHPAQPRSMTLMAGPIDCRVSPTQVNTLATKHPI